MEDELKGLSETEKKIEQKMLFLQETLHRCYCNEPALELKDIAFVLTEELGDEITVILKEMSKLKTKE